MKKQELKKYGKVINQLLKINQKYIFLKKRQFLSLNILFQQYTITKDLIFNMKQVIQILSDSEQKEAFKTKEMKILQKQIQDEASMCNSNTSLLLAVNKQFIEGTPNEKQKVLIERIKKMFIDTCQFNLATDHFCMKREPNYNRQNSQIIHNQLIVFGTDFWPTRKIKSEAMAININLETFKIDDSHTKLKFKDLNDAKRWLQFYGKNNKKIIEKIEEEQNEQMDEQKKQENKLKGWFPLESYYYQEIQRILQARFCTSYQLNVQELIQNVKTTSYMKFKQKMEQEMLKQESAKISYLLAQERKNKQRKYRRNQQHSNFYQDNVYKKGDRTGNRTPNMNRNKSRDYEDRSRDKRKYKNSSFDHDYKRKKSLSPIHHPNQTIGVIRQDPPAQNRQRNTNILGELQDDSGNYSFLLESHNDHEKSDMSIAMAMSQMKIQDNEEFANMSIQIRPKDDKDNNQNMSIVLEQDKNLEPIDMSIQAFLNKPSDKQDKKERKESETQQKKEKQKQKDKKVVEQKQLFDKKAKKNFQSMHTSFDYLKYIEQSEKSENLNGQFRQKPFHE